MLGWYGSSPTIYHDSAFPPSPHLQSGLAECTNWHLESTSTSPALGSLDGKVIESITLYACGTVSIPTDENMDEHLREPVGRLTLAPSKSGDSMSNETSPG